MQISPLVDRWRALGVASDLYRGARTGAHAGAAGGDMRPTGAAPSQSGTAVLYDWSWRAPFRVAGPDARKWLNGMITANVRDLPAGTLVPSFLLDPKGRVQAMLDVVAEADDSFLLITDQSQLQTLLDTLRRFVFIAKLTITDLSESQLSLALDGTAVDALLRSLALPVPASGTSMVADGLRLQRPPRQEQPPDAAVDAPLEIVLAAERAPALWDRLVAAGAHPVPADVLEAERVRHGEPLYGVDVRASELVQETGLLDRVHFAKGCYIGQEIVERIRARGQVHRRLVRLTLAAPVAPGTSLVAAPATSNADGSAAAPAEGEAVGELTSIAPGEMTQDAAAPATWVGLGYLRRPWCEVGKQVLAAGVQAEVVGVIERAPQTVPPAANASLGSVR